jgi:hypothetical protein
MFLPGRSKVTEIMCVTELFLISAASEHEKLIFMGGESKCISGGWKCAITPMSPLVSFKVVRIHGLS